MSCRQLDYASTCLLRSKCTIFEQIKQLLARRHPKMYELELVLYRRTKFSSYGT